MKQKSPYNKKLIYTNIEDAIDEFIQHHNSAWEENSEKTEIAIYDSEPKIRTKKLIEAPIINSKKENGITYIFLGPFPQIPKYNIKLTSNIVDVLQKSGSHYNDYLAFINDKYSVLLQTETRHSYESTRDTKVSHYHKGLGKIIAFNTYFFEKSALLWRNTDEDRNQKIYYPKMLNDINWFGEIIKKTNKYEYNFVEIGKEFQKKLRTNSENRDKERSLLVLCQDKDFANYYCKK